MSVSGGAGSGGAGGVMPRGELMWQDDNGQKIRYFDSPIVTDNLFKLVSILTRHYSGYNFQIESSMFTNFRKINIRLAGEPTGPVIATFEAGTAVVNRRMYVSVTAIFIPMLLDNIGGFKELDAEFLTLFGVYLPISAEQIARKSQGGGYRRRRGSRKSGRKSRKSNRRSSKKRSSRRSGRKSRN